MRGDTQIPPGLPQSYPELADPGVPFDKMGVHLAEVPRDQSILREPKPPEAGLIPDMNTGFPEGSEVPIDRFRGISEVLGKLAGVIPDAAVREAIQDAVAADELAHATCRMSIHPSPSVLS